VDDLPDRFAVTHRGIQLLELGAVERGGSGCICPESVLLKQLVSHILLRRGEVVLLDMYAGVEHLGRATAQAVEALIVVCEPSARSLAIAAQIKALARDIGLTQLFLVGNKIQSPPERAYVEMNSPGLPVLGHLPFSASVPEADRAGVAIVDKAPEMVKAASDIASALARLIDALPQPA
jgi:CO dehydrogenase maturation factor